MNSHSDVSANVLTNRVGGRPRVSTRLGIFKAYSPLPGTESTSDAVARCGSCLSLLMTGLSSTLAIARRLSVNDISMVAYFRRGAGLIGAATPLERTGRILFRMSNGCCNVAIEAWFVLLLRMEHVDM